MIQDSRVLNSNILNLDSLYRDVIKVINVLVKHYQHVSPGQSSCAREKSLQIYQSLLRTIDVGQILSDIVQLPLTRMLVMRRPVSHLQPSFIAKILQGHQVSMMKSA